jgi:dynein intermediate chain 2, axonemal
MDGFLDVWDFYYRQNEIAYSQKVSDAVLTSIRISQSLAAIGDSDGTVSMMSMCRTLYEPAANEKEVMGSIFDRELRREKTLDQAKRKADKAPNSQKQDNKDKIAEKLQTRLKEIENTFFDEVAGDDEDADQIKARGAEQEESKEATQ